MNEDEIRALTAPARSKLVDELYEWAKDARHPSSSLSPEEFVDQIILLVDRSVESFKTKREGGAA